MISINKKILGSKNNLILCADGSIKWSDDMEGCFINVSEDSPIIDYFSLFNLNSLEIFDQKYIKSMELFQCNKIPWRYVIPREDWLSSIKCFVEKIQNIVNNESNKNYLKFFLNSNLSIEKFYKPNVLKLKNKNSDIKLKNFLEKHDSQLLSYDRSSHKTGRLTVISGPNYLTLEKKWKEHLSPSEREYLISIDLISLEPRTLMLTQNKKPLKDVYLSIIKDLGLSNNDRSKVKIYTLASMYSKDFSINGNSIKSNIVKYFDLKNFKKGLINNINDQHIYNFFGRPIYVGEKEINNVINYYIQSTSADVSLYCFSEIKRKFDILPTCIIHDEIICEVDEKTYKEIIENDFIEVPKLGRFYYDIKIINKKV